MTQEISRRRFVQLIVPVSAAGILAACSQPAAPSPTAAPAKPTAAAAPAPAAPAPPAPTTVPPPAAKVGQAVPKDHPTIAALYDEAKKEGRVSWWDQHEKTVAQKFIDTFGKQFPGVEVQYFEATQDVLKTRAVAEARAGQVSFDFVDTGQNYPDYKAAGIIDDKSDFTEILTLAGVPKDYIVNGTYSPEFSVYGAAYNTNMVKPEELPDTLDGFADPKWKGKLAIETRLRPYVYGTPWLGGEDKVVEMLTRLKENNPRPTNGDTASQTLLVAGEFPVLVGAYLQRLIMMKGKPWGFVNLKEVWSNQPGTGYVVPANARRQNAGKLFMFWFMSPEGQALTDELRFKGNPAPGTGTGPSKYLEEHKIAVRFTPNEYEQNYDKYMKKYQAALGLPVN